MDLGEKLKIFKEKGWTCNPDTGEVFSHTGKLINSIGFYGYVGCGIRYHKKMINIKSHQLIWFLSTGKIPKMLDHINGIRNDNRLINLRDVETHQKNQWNQTKSKGYYWNKKWRKFCAQIVLNKNNIFLGKFDTEEEAHQAYLDAKRIYHII